ncbi:MAG: hypothetical protein KDC98_00540, partial [Planctomycetes bacterium]|nr:hypothetical protein [Planctomycetota bacterium]
MKPFTTIARVATAAACILLPLHAQGTTVAARPSNAAIEAAQRRFEKLARTIHLEERQGPGHWQGEGECPVCEWLTAPA